MNVNALTLPNAELNQLSLLSKLAENQLNKIQKTMKLINLSEGEHLFEQGQPAERFFLVRSGQMKLYRVSMEGSERVIEVKQPGDIFAEAVLFLDTREYPLSAAALVNTEILAFDFMTFKSVLEESRETCFQLMANMSKGLHQNLNQVDYLTLQNATFRLVNYLLQQIPADQQTAESYRFELSTSKSIIASCLSIQPETFSRILRSLKTRELIMVKGKSITLMDIAGLKAMIA
ncbi:MAG: Crp/Fnr family transcriptional regulator [Gammaproteobacteria bacterium]|nr:Crp/Fnr family transcriptional regulator [Gammaproteobacteria bacterium]